MKFLLFFLTLSLNLCSNDFITIEKLTFEVPKEIVYWDRIPEFDDINEKNDFLTDKLVLKATYHSSSQVKKLRPNMISKSLKTFIKSKNEITNVNLKELVNENKPFVLTKYFPMRDVKESYELLLIDDEIVGESNFKASADGLLASYTYGYTISIITNDGILYLYLTYYDSELSIAKNYSTYFIENDNEYYWKDKESRLSFYKDLEEGKIENDNLKLLQNSFVKLKKSFNLNK